MVGLRREIPHTTAPEVPASPSGQCANQGGGGLIRGRGWWGATVLSTGPLVAWRRAGGDPARQAATLLPAGLLPRQGGSGEESVLVGGPGPKSLPPHRSLPCRRCAPAEGAAVCTQGTRVCGCGLRLPGRERPKVFGCVPRAAGDAAGEAGVGGLVRPARPSWCLWACLRGIAGPSWRL